MARRTRRASTAHLDDDNPQTTRRKRRASSIASDTSYAEAASPGGSQATARSIKSTRNRRTRRSDSEQLTQELDYATTHLEEDVEEDVDAEAPEHEYRVGDTIAVDNDAHLDKRVRFSDPVIPIDQHPSSPPVYAQNSTALTSLFSTVEARPTKSTKIRHSLPARLDGSPAHFVEQFQFKPLAQVLSDRNKRRLKRSHLSEEINHIELHKRQDAKKDRELAHLQKEIAEKDKILAELTLAAEERRLMDIELGGQAEREDEMQTLKAELATLKEKFAAKERGQHLDTISEGAEMDMDDDMTFIQPEDLNISPADMTPNTSFERKTRTLVTASFESTPDMTRELEVQKFEKAIEKVSREAADASATLRTLSIELQSLGFTDPEEPANKVCSAIRLAFQQARGEAEELLPDQAVNTFENGDFLKLLLGNIRDLLGQVDEDIKQIHKHEEMEALLHTQYDGVVELLAQKDAHNHALNNQWRQLDRHLDEKRKEIIELQNHNSRIEELLEERENELDQQNTRVEELEGESADQISQINDLNNALEDYRNQLSNMETLIENLRQEHAEKVSELQKDSEESIQHLCEELDEEHYRRRIAEKEINEKTTYISTLEVKLNDTKIQVDSLVQQLEEAQEYAAQEKGDREAAEADAQEKSNIIDDHIAKIETLHTQVDELTEMIEQLRQLRDNERRQRERAEADFDTSTEKIAELEARLRDGELQANELRMKLFEAQQDKLKTVEEFEVAASEREQQHEKAMDAEISRREEAQRTVELNNSTIQKLESNLENLDRTMKELLQVKEIELKNRDNTIDKLEADLDQANRDYKSMSEKADANIESLNDEIAALNDKITLQADRIDDLEELNRNLAQSIEEKDGEIEDLKDDLKMAHTRSFNLDAQIESCERRIESQAEELLSYQDHTATEIEGLNKKLKDRNEQIAELEREALARQEEWEFVLETRDEEILELKNEHEDNGLEIKRLKRQIELLKRRFKERVYSDKNSAIAMLESMRTALDQAEDVANDLAESGDRDLVEMDMDVDPEVDGLLEEAEQLTLPQTPNGQLIAPSVSAPASVNGMNGIKAYRASKRIQTLRRKSKTKKVRDSGVGMSSDGLEVEAETQMEMQEVGTGLF